MVNRICTPLGEHDVSKASNSNERKKIAALPDN
jgi:hypothetical protein